METKEIIKACINKDESAFRLLMDTHIDFAFSVAFRILNDSEEANDAVQESFISVWKNIDSFKIDKNFSNWLYRIIVNKCNDSLRIKKRHALVHPDSFEWNIPELFNESNSDTKLTNEETGKLIRFLTKKLSSKQKIVFILSDLQGLNHDDISEITGLGKNAIKSNLNHARRNIGKTLEKHLEE